MGDCIHPDAKWIAPTILASFTLVYATAIWIYVKKKRGRKRKDAGSDEPKEEKEEKEEAVVDPFAFLVSGPDCPWLPAVKRILGNDCVFAHLGCIMSLPGSTVSLQPVARCGELRGPCSPLILVQP